MGCSVGDLPGGKQFKRNGLRISFLYLNEHRSGPRPTGKTEYTYTYRLMPRHSA